MYLSPYFVLFFLLWSIAESSTSTTTNGSQVPNLKEEWNIRVLERKNSSDGTNLDLCKQDSDCLKPRTCKDITDPDNMIACEGQDECYCWNEHNRICKKSSECDYKYLCARDAANEKFCYLCSGATGNDTGVEAIDTCRVCIAIDALQHVPQSSLIFPTHKQASVLCDTYGNCATPGHMVIYKNNPMSMFTYCKLKNISCSRRVTLVNSPRMQFGLRINSKSMDLVYTAFAATRETRMEEALLRTIISIGA